jgi:hypothetical protein
MQGAAKTSSGMSVGKSLKLVIATEKLVTTTEKLASKRHHKK